MDLPFNTVGLQGSEVDTLKETYESLRKKFTVDISCTEKLDLNNFDVLKWYQDPIHHNDFNEGGLLKISTPLNECYLVFLKIRHYFTNRAAIGEGIDYYNYQAWALVRQKKDFGRALIRKETFTDRILSIIHPQELEFSDDKPFDRKFYVVANEPEKAKNAMNFNFRNALMGIELGNFCIEANDKELLIGINDWLCPDHALRATEIACKLASLS